MDQNTKKFLDFLGKAEGAGYDTIVGGKLKVTDFSKHPNIVGLTTSEGPSTAAGKYQITGTTYRAVAPKLGITDFTPESQDKIALELIRQKGALADVQQGNWDAAIGKLGGVWASLPSSPYKQPKRTAEFVQKHLGGGADPSAEQQFSMTAPGSTRPTEGLGQAQLAISQAQNQSKYGGFVNQVASLPAAISDGFKNENSVYNWWMTRGLESHDPNFQWTEEMAGKALEGVPTDNRDYVLQAGSWDEVVLRRGRVMEALERQKELSNMGFAGLVGTAAGALIDLPTLVGFVPVVGGAAIISRTSRIANALASGLAAGAGNVAADAALLKYRPLGSTDELYFSALAGLGFGALGGSLIDPAARFAALEARRSARSLGEGAGVAGRSGLDEEFTALRQHGQREANNLRRQEVREAGLDLTPNGKIILDDPTARAARSTRWADDDGAVNAIRAERGQVPVYDRTTPAANTSSAAHLQEPPTKGVGSAKTPGSAKETLGSLAQNALDPMVKTLAARIAGQLLDDVSIYRVPKSALPEGRSHYDPTRHVINLRDDAPEWVQLHEIAHAATVQKIHYGRDNPSSVHGQIVAQLNATLEEARVAAKAAGMDKDGLVKEYLSNIEEFTAGLYSGKSKFTDLLEKTADGAGQTILSKVINAVRKLLGMGGDETNMLVRSLDLTDRLINERLDVNIRRPGDISPEVSIHMEPMAGVQVDPEVVTAVATAGVYPIFGRSFGLEHTTRKHPALAGAFRLADKLFGTTVGYKGHGVVERNAWDQTLSLSGGWSDNVRKVADAQFKDYFRRSGRKFWERDEVAKDFNEQLGDYVRGFNGEYDKAIRTTGDEIRSKLADVVDNINNPAKATGGTKRGLTQDIYKDELGNELLTDALPKNDNYLPRAHDVHKWDEMVNQFGRDFVEKWWAGAFRSANPGVAESVSERFGKWYVKRVELSKKNKDGEFLSEQLRGFDKEALRDSMHQAGLSDVDAQDLLDNMFPKTHKGQGAVASNTKQRSMIDETFSMQVNTPGDMPATVTMNNFINTDTIGVLDGYFKRMGGAIALANHVDIYKNTDIGEAILRSTTVSLGDKLPQYAVDTVREHLQFAFDRILNRPVQDFSVFNKSLDMWRSFNVIRLMGAAVYNQAQELSQTIGSVGWKATVQAIPQLGAWRRDLLTGKVVNPMLNDIENMIGGAGSDLVARADFNPSDDWVREMGNTKFNQWLDRADNSLKRMSSGVLKYTGMTGLMVQQKRIHAIAFINHFMDVASNGKKLGFNKERLAWMGLNGDSLNQILANMKKYATTKEGVTGKKVNTVDFDKWAAADPDSLSRFTTAFQRESRRVVQENDLASTIPVMGKGWAQTMFQFLNFSLHGWNKSLLFAMHHRDFQTFSTVMHGSLFAAITYMARTQAAMVGMSDDERREFAARRLSTKQIVANSFGRIAQASLLPNIIDQVSPIPIFSGMRTTSDATDFLSSNPTATAINTLFSAMRKSVRNGFSDDYQFTRQDVQSYFKLLPLNNVVGISGLLNALSKDLPTQEDLNPEPKQ